MNSKIPSKPSLIQFGLLWPLSFKPKYKIVKAKNKSKAPDEIPS